MLIELFNPDTNNINKLKLKIHSNEPCFKKVY